MGEELKPLEVVTEKARILPHGYLAEAAKYFAERSRRRMNDCDRSCGISHEVKAGLIMLAFAHEARVNFLGLKFVDAWNERDSASRKFKQVCSALKLPTEGPNCELATLKLLAEIRNGLAHPKPVYRERSSDLIAGGDHQFSFDFFDDPVAKMATIDVLEQGIEHAQSWWHSALEAGGLGYYDIVSWGDRSFSRIDDEE